MQVITIKPNGEISGLQVKPGKGLDLTKVGKAHVERASEILWDEDRQRWYVQVLQGPLAGQKITRSLLAEYEFDYSNSVVASYSYRGEDDVILCEDYDVGVKLEVQFLDHCRLKGIF